MADGLDVVAVGVVDIRPVVVLVVVRPHAGRTVVLAARGDGGLVEAVDRLPIGCPERDVRSPALRVDADPEVRDALGACESRIALALHRERVPQGLQRLLEEGSRAADVADGCSDVIDHGLSFRHVETTVAA